MLKKILVMFTVLTAIFSPVELRASEYNPYADSVPIPKTEEKKPAPKQPEQKKAPTVKKKPAFQKTTPRKRVSRPAKAKTNAHEQKNAAIDSHTVAKSSTPLKTEQQLYEEHRIRLHNYIIVEIEQTRLSITDWDFRNMTVKLRDEGKGTIYNLKLRYDDKGK